MNFLWIESERDLFPLTIFTYSSTFLKIDVLVYNLYGYGHLNYNRQFSKFHQF